MISHSKSCLKSSTMLLLYRIYVCFKGIEDKNAYRKLNELL